MTVQELLQTALYLGVYAKDSGKAKPIDRRTLWKHGKHYCIPAPIASGAGAGGRWVDYDEIALYDFIASYSILHGHFPGELSPLFNELFGKSAKMTFKGVMSIRYWFYYHINKALENNMPIFSAFTAFNVSKELREKINSIYTPANIKREYEILSNATKDINLNGINEIGNLFVNFYAELWCEVIVNIAKYSLEIICAEQN